MTQRGRRIGLTVARGAALFLAVLTIVGLIGELRGRTTDLSLWWIDLRDVPGVVRLGLLATSAFMATVWAVNGTRTDLVRGGAAMAFGGFAVLATRDVIRYFDAVQGGLVDPAIPVPLSLFLVAGLAGLGLTALLERGRAANADAGNESRPRIVGIVLAAAGWAIDFPIAQMLFFGTTDYRRPADIAVVFGARVYATGRPSPLLADRIRTAVDLYRAGDAPILLMSGGDGADGFNEARVMREVAIAAGVDPDAILIDPSGNSTEATVNDVMAILATRTAYPGLKRVLAVSQSYHLPRIQLAFANVGIDVLTVPASDAQPIRELPLLMLREVPAFWAYYLRICLG